MKYENLVGLYEFVKENPLMWVDPMGEAPVVAGILAGYLACIGAAGYTCAEVADTAIEFEILPGGARGRVTSGIVEEQVDKWKHCFCSSEIARICGISGSVLAGLGKEAIDEFKYHFGDHLWGWDWEDVEANAKGWACSGSLGIPLVPKLTEWLGFTETSCECCNKMISACVPLKFTCH